MPAYIHIFTPWRKPSKGVGGYVMTSDKAWGRPFGWDRDAFAKCYRYRVVCPVDVFDDWDGQMLDLDGAPLIDKLNEQPYTLDGARRDLFRLIDRTPNLDWLLTTKLPQNIGRMWPEVLPVGNLDPIASAPYAIRMRSLRSNVWLGTSIATQEDADRNIPLLLKCGDLSPVLFVSAEPLLEAVDVRRWTSVGLQCSGCDWSGCEDSSNVKKPFSGESSDYEFTCPECDEPCGHTPMDECIDWLICGGESGPKARPMHPALARSLRDQCQTAGVPFFFKQWGEWFPRDQWEFNTELILPDDCDAYHGCDRTRVFSDCGEQYPCHRVGKAAAGRLLDGREWNEFPRVEGGAT